MGMGASKPGVGPAGGTPARASLRSYFISPPTSPPETPDSSPPHSPRSPIREPRSVGGRHAATPPTPIANASQPMSVPVAPFSGGVNMCVSPSGPVPTGQERVATVFTWAHGGKNVAVTGTWNNWQGVIPLNRSEHDFTAIIDLPPGVHQYKFIVDGKWTHAADQPVATDSRGNLNNCMEIKEFRLGQSRNNALGRGSPPGSYTQEIPDVIKFNDMFDEPQDLGAPSAPGAPKKKPDEPPVLPPHLLGTRAVLNIATDDPTVLPLPNHVMLNHLYFRKHEDDHKREILILGTTQRYREKFVTTVFYKAAPSLSDVQTGGGASSRSASTSTSPSMPARGRGISLVGGTTSQAVPGAAVASVPGGIGGASSRPVARQLFSPRGDEKGSGGGGGISISDTIGSPRPLVSDDGPTPAPTNHPTMTALTMDRGGEHDGTKPAAAAAAAPLPVPAPAPATTGAMNIVAKRRVSVSGDGTVFSRSPVQEEGPGSAFDVVHADYSLRHNMG